MAYTRQKTVNFGAGNAGLSTVGYTLLPGGSRITAGVAEIGTATGCYGASVSISDGFAGAILWDTGEGGATVYAAEEINPGSDENTDAKVTSRSTFAGGAVASVTGNVGGNVVGSVGSLVGHTPQTGDSFARIGSTGSGLTSLATQASVNTIDGIVDDILVDTGTTLPGLIVALPTATEIMTEVWTPGNMPTPTPVGDFAEAVRDVDNTAPAADSLGAAINSAASAGDPWSTTIPGSYGAGTAGKIVGDNLNATVSSRATPAQVNAEADAAIADAALATAANLAAAKADTAAIKLKTDNLPASPAAVGSNMGTVASVTGAVGSVTGNVGGNVAGSVGSVVGHTPQTGDSFARIGATGSGLTSLAPAATALSNATWTDTKAGYLDASILSVSTGGVSPEDIAAAVVTAFASDPIGAHVVSMADGVLTAAAIATDAITSAKLAADCIGASEVSAAAVTKIQTGLTTGDTAGTTTLLSRLTAQRATNLDNLDATVSSRATAAALATAAGYVDTEVAAIKADTAAIKLKTDNLPASPAAVGSAMTVSGTVNATLVSTGLDAIPTTLTGAPGNFREWLVWLTCRFRRTRLDKATGDLEVYGSTGSAVVTTQATTDDEDEQTVGATS